MVLLLLLAVLAGVAFFVLGRGTGSRPQGEGGPSLPVQASEASPERVVDAPASRGEVQRAATEPEPEPGLGSTAGRPDPRLFDGRGTLRGSVEILGDLPPPAAWTLVLRPSLTLFGREHAESREIHFAGSERDFLVEDLPLGGYDVQARAPGRNGRALPVMLTRQSPSPFLVLEITPASYLEGDVLDPDSLPVEGLELFLESSDTRERVRTLTTAAGSYRFDDVRDGAYRLIVGPVANPLVPPRALRLASPGMRFPAIEVPKLGALDVFVFDENGSYLPDAKVTGSGTKGSLLDGTTNVDGHIPFRNLAPGRFRLRAEHPQQPERSSRRIAIEVLAGESVRVELRFEP